PRLGEGPPDRSRRPLPDQEGRPVEPAGASSVTQSSRDFVTGLLNPNRRAILKSLGAALATSLVPAGIRHAHAFAYEPYLTDDQLETVVTSCAHNCGSRHMLVAHKKGDVIVRLSTDNGTYQGDAFNTDTEEVPQIRACLRGRSYRARLYSPERLLYPMK